MKRISILLAICLLLGIPVQAAAPAAFQYQSSGSDFPSRFPVFVRARSLPRKLIPA